MEYSLSLLLWVWILNRNPGLSLCPLIQVPSNNTSSVKVCPHSYSYWILPSLPPHGTKLTAQGSDAFNTKDFKNWLGSILLKSLLFPQWKNPNSNTNLPPTTKGWTSRFSPGPGKPTANSRQRQACVWQTPLSNAAWWTKNVLHSQVQKLRFWWESSWP